MDFWLITNGVKSGPFPDYVVRSRISFGELDADTRIWHEGLAEWARLGELDLFKGEFVKEEIPEGPPELPSEYVEAAKAVPDVADAKVKPAKHLLRRFCARWMDLTVYSGVWWLVMYLAGRDIGMALDSLWLLLPMYFPWFMLESWLLHRFGTTLGKWLMSLNVVNEDDSSMSLKAAIWRSIRVLTMGVGFGLPLLLILCQVMCWFTARRIGRPVWDFLGQHKVVAGKLSPFRVLYFLLLFAGASLLQTAVKGPHVREAIVERYPDTEKHLDGGWYLPVKK